MADTVFRCACIVFPWYQIRRDLLQLMIDARVDDLDNADVDVDRSALKSDAQHQRRGMVILWFEFPFSGRTYSIKNTRAVVGQKPNRAAED